MSSPKTFRSRRRVASRSPLLLERLERRLPLAGNVTAQLVGSTLVLTGDAAGNELVVASAAGGRLAVFGNATTINGASTTPNPFVTTRAVTSVVANLNAGNDVIGFGNDAEQRADGQHLAVIGDALAQNAADRALEDIGDLRGLDVHDFLARRDGLALLDRPFRQGAFLHGKTPFRHDDRLDVGHGAAPAAIKRLGRPPVSGGRPGCGG